MAAVSIRTFTAGDIPALEALLAEYAAVYPGRPVWPGGMYCSPAFHGGEDVFCAFDGEQMLAYAPLYFQPSEAPDQPAIAWIENLASPALADPLPVKDALLEQLIARARVLAGERPVRLTFDYATSETAASEYALARGFSYLQSAYSMACDLVGADHDRAVPSGITLRRWKMESEAEQRVYVQARNSCFPDQPIALEHWQHYLRSPQWAVGTMIAAFAGEALVGAVSVYWSEEENQAAERPFGYTEDIFVCAPWRGQGVARAAIREALRYLQEHGLQQAHLTVAAQNENALALYRQLGYRLVSENRHYARVI